MNKQKKQPMRSPKRRTRLGRRRHSRIAPTAQESRQTSLDIQKSWLDRRVHKVRDPELAICAALMAGTRADFEDLKQHCETMLVAKQRAERAFRRFRTVLYAFRQKVRDCDQNLEWISGQAETEAYGVSFKEISEYISQRTDLDRDQVGPELLKGISEKLLLFVRRGKPCPLNHWCKDKKS